MANIERAIVEILADWMVDRQTVRDFGHPDNDIRQVSMFVRVLIELGDRVRHGGLGLRWVQRCRSLAPRPSDLSGDCRVDFRFGFAVLQQGGGFDLGVRTTPLTAEEVERYEQMGQVLGDLRPMVIDHISLEFDFYALEDVVPWTQRAVAILEHPFGVPGVLTTFVLAQAQRLLSNFLASASAFRDRLSTAISAKFGADSEQALAWKAAQSRAYDECFAYRLLYALRNYSQHQEAPINLIQVNGRRNDTGKMVHDFELTLDRDKLLSDKRLKASVRNELSAMGSPLPITPLATAYMRAHRKFALDLLLAESPRLGVLEDFARSVFTGGGIPDGSVPFILEGGALEDVAPETPVKRNVRTLGFDELILLKVLAGRLQVDPPPRIEMGLGWIAQAQI